MIIVLTIQPFVIFYVPFGVMYMYMYRSNFKTTSPIYNKNNSKAMGDFKHYIYKILLELDQWLYVELQENTSGTNSKR